MREILFKAKRIDNGEWVEGHYMRHINRTPCPIGDGVKESDISHIILFSGFSDWNLPKPINYVAVDPSTVCQYTGLTDRNGKKIFEGDILRVWSECCDYDYKTTVGGKYGYPNGFYVDGDFDGGDFNCLEWAMEYWSEESAEIEVIGNIHDKEAADAD